VGLDDRLLDDSGRRHVGDPVVRAGDPVPEGHRSVPRRVRLAVRPHPVHNSVLRMHYFDTSHIKVHGDCG
jgi:hypothetical protein